MTKIVEIWSCSCNIPKSSCKQIQVACSRKWTGYILADFYQCKKHKQEEHHNSEQLGCREA